MLGVPRDTWIRTYMIEALLQSPWFLPELFFRLSMLCVTGVSMLISADGLMDWHLFW